jgi:hypothetical protein
MFDETPGDSAHRVNLLEFWGFPHPGAGGICETPAETESEMG